MLQKASNEALYLVCRASWGMKARTMSSLHAADKTVFPNISDCNFHAVVQYVSKYFFHQLMRTMRAMLAFGERCRERCLSVLKNANFELNSLKDSHVLRIAWSPRLETNHLQKLCNDSCWLSVFLSSTLLTAKFV